MFHTLLGTGLVASAAAALNQLLERDYDALMKRTEDRPPAFRAAATGDGADSAGFAPGGIDVSGAGGQPAHQRRGRDHLVQLPVCLHAAQTHHLAEHGHGAIPGRCRP